jgi:type VI secretion system protein VasD
MRKIDAKNSFHFLIRNLCILLALGFVTSCKSQVKPEDSSSILITLVADKYINPNEHGIANPVRVTLYQLSRIETFMMSDYLTLLYGSDSDNMSVIKKDVSYVLAPGEVKNFLLNLDGDVDGLGVVTAYQDIENSQWRVSYIMPKKKHEHWYGSFFSTQESEPPQLIVNIKYLTTSITQMD